MWPYLQQQRERINVIASASFAASWVVALLYFVWAESLKVDSGAEACVVMLTLVLLYALTLMVSVSSGAILVALGRRGGGIYLLFGAAIVYAALRFGSELLSF